MNPVSNPFVPSAGSAPPELAGRDEVILEVDVAMRRLIAGKTVQATLLVGLRGVGKTVLLEHLRRQSEATGIVCVAMEAPEGKSLPELLVPQLRAALLELDRWKGATTKLSRAYGALRNFVAGVKVKYEGVEIGIGNAPIEKGVADSGDIEQDLRELLLAIGEAAAERQKAVALFIDELQYVPERELGCRFQKAAALNVRSRLHYGSGWGGHHAMAGSSRPSAVCRRGLNAVVQMAAPHRELPLVQFTLLGQSRRLT